MQGLRYSPSNSGRQNTVQIFYSLNFMTISTFGLDSCFYFTFLNVLIVLTTQNNSNRRDNLNYNEIIH